MIELIPENKAKELHWYIQIKNRETGPYSYLEICCMIGNDDITGSDQIYFSWCEDIQYSLFSL